MVKFLPKTEDDRVEFTFPPDWDPFQGIFDLKQVQWRLPSNDPPTIQFIFQGQPGPLGIVVRHPIHWGFITISAATVYTSWPIPDMGEDELSEDVAIDNYVADVVNEDGYPLNYYRAQAT